MNVRPEPVVARALASALATWAAALLVAWAASKGVLVPDDVSEPLRNLLEVGLVAVIGGGGALVAAVRARAHVTPIEDPVDAAGRPLTPAGDEAGDHHPDLDENRPPVDIAALRREYHLDPPEGS